MIKNKNKTPVLKKTHNLTLSINSILISHHNNALNHLLKKLSIKHYLRQNSNRKS